VETTLRSVSVAGGRVVAVGASGLVLAGDLADPMGLWIAPECKPPPIDERPTLTAVASTQGGAFHVVGSGGAVLHYAIGAQCGLEPRTGGPAAFLTAVASVGDQRAYITGDGGLFAEVRGNRDPQVEVIPTEIEEGFQALWVDNDAGGNQRVRMIGAGGAIVTAVYYPPPPEA
jgi:hypothetical protein